MRFLPINWSVVMRAGAILALLILSIGLFYWTKSDPRIFRVASPDNANLILALSVLGFGISGKDVPAAFRILQAYITVSMTLYLVSGYKLHDLEVGHPFADWVWLPIVCAIASYWRPSLALIPVMAVMWTKILARKDIGLGVSSTDYMVVLELGVIMAYMLIPASLLFIAARLRGAWTSATQDFLRDYFNAAVVFAAAVHLSNYFFSGYEKLILENATWFTWMLENPTYILTAAVLDFDYFTIFDIPMIPKSWISIVEWITVPLNILVLAAQLAVVFAFFSRRFMIGITLFFDLMHLAIFGLTAIFFWKWILLNAGMVHAFRKLKLEKWSVPLWVSGSALCLMFASTSFLQVAKLGWFDSGGVNHAYWQVETKDGSRINAPTNFFLDTSITFAQQRPGRPFNGFLPTHDWGTTIDAKIMRRFTDKCDVQEPLAPALVPEKLAIAGDYVLRHHARVLERAGGSGNIAYDWYPHHIWSSPFRFEDFRTLDLSTVTAYILVVKAKCIRTTEGGAIEIKELTSDETRFPL